MRSIYHRLCNISKEHSFFLIGARGTGKSSLIEKLFRPQEALFLDLLKPSDFDTFNKDPEELSRRISALKKDVQWVIIDEIQRIPKLLNLVHYHIEHSKLKFALTGSSARKLKRGSANLLAGRAVVYSLFPLTALELGVDFKLADALSWGTLPHVINTEDTGLKRKILQAYTHTYLKEEVQQEQLIRSLDPFHLFLSIAAQMNGKIINYSSIARECGASDHSIREYFQILEDTLLGFFLPPFHESIRKRQRSNPKFYLFDQGVERALSGLLKTAIEPKTYGFGVAFENFNINEIFRLQSYFEKDYHLAYLRTKDDAEIDLIIERPGIRRALVEIKSTTRVTESDVASLLKFHKDFHRADAYCLSLDPNPKKFGSVDAIPWQQGLIELGLTE